MIGVLTRPNAALRSDPDVRRMLRLRRGDTTAFQELLERHRDGVRQQLLLMVGNGEEAEDLTQEVFLRVFRHRKRYEPRAKFITWLYHIVRNIGRNALRDRKRRPALPLFSASATEAGGHPGAALSDHRAEPPLGPLERGEIRGLVRSAIQKLGRRQREALELQQFEDRSYAEIADHLALTPEAAKSLLYRARNQLRVELAPYVLM